MFSDYSPVENMGSEGRDHDQEHRETVLHQSMQRLSDESREILVMSRYQNMKYEEIAEIMDLTVSAVKVKVHRAIKKLRDVYFELEKI